MPVSLEGQVCLITGASAGIGEACAMAFANDKCTLILLARRQERLQAVKEKILAAYDV
jgi:3-hydroxy acid dehydrogenase / malonic semialdehyde reductase